LRENATVFLHLYNLWLSAKFKFWVYQDLKISNMLLLNFLRTLMIFRENSI